MGSLKIASEDIDYAVRQMGTAMERPFGRRHWEAHLAHIEEEEHVPSEDSLYGYLFESLIFMCNLERHEEGSGDARGMRDVITFVYAAAFSANAYTLPLVRRGDVERVRALYQPAVTNELADCIQDDAARVLNRVNPIWAAHFVEVVGSMKMSPFQRHLASSCALALLIKFGIGIEFEHGDEAPPISAPEKKQRQQEPETRAPGQITDIRTLSKAAVDVTFDDVGGCHDAKRELLHLARRVNQPSVVLRWGGMPTKGVLIHGPKGTGKTTLVQAFAREVDLPFFSFRVSDVLSMWVNDSARQLRGIFSQVRNGGGGIIFFDEADALFAQRGSFNSHHEDDKIVNEWNSIMDSIGPDERVVVFLATNFIENLDDAAIRDGRIDLVVSVTMPNEKDREEVFRVHALRTERTARRAVFAPDVRFDELARRTDGIAPAAIRSIVQHAVDGKIDADLDGHSPSLITTEDLLDAIAARSAQRNDRASCRIGFTRAIPRTTS